MPDNTDDISSPDPPRPAQPLGRLIGADGTVWIRRWIPGRRPDEQAMARRKSALHAKITYVCEAASRTSGLSAAHHAGIPEERFRRWQEDRNFSCWPSDDTAKVIAERMLLDGYRLERPRDEGLLRALVDAEELGYELYKAAAPDQGPPQPS